MNTKKVNLIGLKKLANTGHLGFHVEALIEHLNKYIDQTKHSYNIRMAHSANLDSIECILTLFNGNHFNKHIITFNTTR